MLLQRILLYPFAVIYDLATRARNHLYNIGSKPTFQFENFVMSVGNLSVGGTGKTPAIEYLIRLLSSKYKTTTLSRGYGRKTKGFRLANDKDSATTIGDEPFQFYKKYKNIHVAVGEQRALAIPEILFRLTENEIILLDDAFQHRSVTPNVNILLSQYNRPFYKDYILPAGRLREARKGANRADVVIVTKCPEHLTQSEMESRAIQIKNYTNSQCQIYFSYIKYQDPKPLINDLPLSNNVILVSGIADNSEFENFAQSKFNVIESLSFGDHYRYTEKDIDDLVKIVKQNNNSGVSILTTEKDAVRMLENELMVKLDQFSVFYIPIEMQFVKDGKVFDEFILNSITSK